MGRQQRRAREERASCNGGGYEGGRRRARGLPGGRSVHEGGGENTSAAELLLGMGGKAAYARRETAAEADNGLIRPLGGGSSPQRLDQDRPSSRWRRRDSKLAAAEARPGRHGPAEDALAAAELVAMVATAGSRRAGRRRWRPVRRKEARPMVVEADAWRRPRCDEAAVEARARRVPVRYDEAGRRGARKCSRRRRWPTQREARLALVKPDEARPVAAHEGWPGRRAPMQWRPRTSGGLNGGGAMIHQW
uniref:DUF834 domain-containing protein n=1 Tax=Oryza glumipatula TaxID=40148 RepID=A0A0D9ZZ55_9ORYZ